MFMIKNSVTQPGFPLRPGSLQFFLCERELFQPSALFLSASNPLSFDFWRSLGCWHGEERILGSVKHRDPHSCSLPQRPQARVGRGGRSLMGNL